MAISQDTQARMAEALTLESAGNEVCTALNNSQALAAQSSLSHPAAVVASHASATTDFSMLLAGDLVAHIPATAGSAQFGSVVAAGTLPFGPAVIGDLYIVLRSVSYPPAANIIL